MNDENFTVTQREEKRGSRVFLNFVSLRVCASLSCRAGNRLGHISGPDIPLIRGYISRFCGSSVHRDIRRSGRAGPEGVSGITKFQRRVLKNCNGRVRQGRR